MRDHHISLSFSLSLVWPVISLSILEVEIRELRSARSFRISLIPYRFFYHYGLTQFDLDEKCTDANSAFIASSISSGSFRFQCNSVWFFVTATVSWISSIDYGSRAIIDKVLDYKTSKCQWNLLKKLSSISSADPVSVLFRWWSSRIVLHLPQHLAFKTYIHHVHLCYERLKIAFPIAELVLLWKKLLESIRNMLCAGHMSKTL